MKKGIFLMLLIGVCTFVFGTHDDNYIEEDFELVLFDPGAHIGRKVIWAGEIIKVTQNKDSVELTVIEIPLDYFGKAEAVRYARGRFIAQSADTAIASRFKIGDLAIITGKVAGSKTKPLGKEQYTYPLVSIKVIHPCERSDEYGVLKKTGSGSMVKIKGPFCTDPQTREKHAPSEHHHYD